MHGGEVKFLIERLRAQTTRTKTPVLAIIFRVPLSSVSPYLNHHNFYFPVSKILPALINTSNFHDGVIIVPPHQASS
jgi:hypothetical protein